MGSTHYTLIEPVCGMTMPNHPLQQSSPEPPKPTSGAAVFRLQRWMLEGSAQAFGLKASKFRSQATTMAVILVTLRAASSKTLQG